jgi:hypothetical protein
MADLGEHWCIMLRAQRRPVPAIIRLRQLLKCAKRSYGIVCERLDVPAEMRQLQTLLALRDAEIERLKQLVQSLADRCAGQAQLLEARRAEKPTHRPPEGDIVSQERDNAGQEPTAAASVSVYIVATPARFF